MDKYEDYGAHVLPSKRRTSHPSIAPEIERPPSEAASSSHHGQTKGHHEKEEEKKVEGAPKVEVLPGSRSWNTYGTTFYDEDWTNIRVRDDRRGWDEWKRDQGARREDEEEDTGR